MASERTVVITAGGLQALARHPLSKVEGMVLWRLVGALPHPGDVVSQAQLAADLAVTPMQANRAIKRLCTDGFLMRGVKAGASYHYKLNPTYLRII